MSKLTVTLPDDLHAQIRQELEEQGITTGQFIEMVVTKYFTKDKKGENNMATRTIAFQVSEELYQRIKDYLKQKFGKQALKNIYLNAVVCDVEGERIMFSHFPVFNRKPRDRFANARDILDTAFRLAQCSLNIHGHLHSRESGNDFCVNVSCEKLGFIPRTLGEVLRSHRKKRSFDD